MNHTERGKVVQIFTTRASPCESLNFEGCEELHKKFKKAFNAPGCTACARRRAKNKYGAILIEKINSLEWSEVVPNENP